MPDPAPEPSSIERLQAGDEQAAAQLYNAYVGRLLSVAQRRLNSTLAARFDAEDIVQSVFRSFFSRARDGRFVFSEADDVGKLLVQITIHKTLKQIDFHRRGKRNPGLEIAPSDDQRQLLLAHMAKEPTPVEAAIFVDQLEHFLGQLLPEDRKIIEMRLAGHDNVEIATQLGISDRKIRRLMERMRGQAEKEQTAP
jgi:RNA polymerase sigma-70 factor (ECF subfamily)